LKFIAVKLVRGTTFDRRSSLSSKRNLWNVVCRINSRHCSRRQIALLLMFMSEVPT